MLSSFEQLFGLPKAHIHPICVLVPFISKPLVQALSLKNRFRGKPYAGFTHQNFTLIETRMGPLFTGDAALNLKDSPCQTILFIGACGSLDEQTFPIGTVVSPTASYAIESFSMMAANRLSFDFNISARPHPLWSHVVTADRETQCASVGSITLENAFVQLFKNNNTGVLDMECSSVFAAASKINTYASALLYVTDIIGKTSPYDINNDHHRLLIENAQDQAARMILDAVEILN